jgi:ASHX domain-containing protein
MQEKIDIIALMPQTIPAVNSGSMTRPDTAFLASDDNFNADCGLYLRHLGNGQHAKKWLRDAMAAHDRHRNGEFNDDIKKKFTDEWGEDWPVEEGEEVVEEEVEEAEA